MEKRVLVYIVFLSLTLIMPVVFAEIADDEIQRLTHYATEYEIGNIDYIRLVLYISSIRENLNEELGAVGREHGGVFKQDQVRKLFGDPTDETKWVWNHKEQKDKKFTEPVPTWEKIVFDGKKIQIRLGAWPSFFSREHVDDEGEEFFDESNNYYNDELVEGDLVYSINFDINFKRPQDQIDVLSKIDDIKLLAENYYANPTSGNAQLLAKESVNVEKAFEASSEQSGDQCESLMSSIFGSENRRRSQTTLNQEISFFDGDDFVAIINIDSCEDCGDWRWIGMHAYVDSRGGDIEHPEDSEYDNDAWRKYENYNFDKFEKEISNVINEMRQSLLERNFGKFYDLNNELNIINNAWNDESNDVWEEVDSMFPDNYEPEDGEYDPYYWIKQDQERREIEKEIRNRNYEKRKSYILNLFSGSEIRETYFEEQEWEKRLVEIFKEFGEEICDNNIDDNNNGQIDCQESSCGGKFAGIETKSVENEEGLINEITYDLYCIDGERKEKEVVGVKGAVCGNNICEIGEAVLNEISEEDGISNFCPEDCFVCPFYNPVECDGKLISSGLDEKGCPLESICVEEKSCENNEDCKFRCGIGECIEGLCELAELTECEEAECVEGKEEIKQCFSGQNLVVKICVDGFWEDTGLDCSGENKGKDFECAACGNECISADQLPVVLCEETIEEFECVAKNGECVRVDTDYKESVIEETEAEVEEIAGNACSTVSDCGGVNDICSNGYCDSIHVIVTDEEIDVIFKEVREKIEEVEIDRDEFEEEFGVNGEGVDGGGFFDFLRGSEDLEKNIGDEREEITGNVVFRFFKGLGGITGNVVTGFDIDQNDEFEKNQNEEVEPENIQCPEIPSPEYDRERCTIEEIFDDSGCLSGYSEPICDENDDYIESFVAEIFDDQGYTFVVMRWVIDGESLERDLDIQVIDEKSVLVELQRIASELGFEMSIDEINEISDVYYEGNYFHDEDDFNDEYNDEFEEEYYEDNKDWCKDDCQNMCYETEIVGGCVEDCVGLWDDDDEIGDLDECKEKCESNVDLSECVDTCIPRCENGEDIWRYDDFEGHKEEIGVFRAGGICRSSDNRKESFVFFDGWGEFDVIHKLKNKFYDHGADWCKWELENNIKRRIEFEKGFNEEFAKWFFENYLANSADNWENHVSGIYEIYWSNVNSQEQIAWNLRCLGKEDILDFYVPELINFKYETEYGSIEYWEELEPVRINDDSEKVNIISPYMKVWIFPNKEFIISEMKIAMREGEFPGPDDSDRENEEGLKEEEKNDIKRNQKFMNKIKEVSDKYGGSIESAIQLKNYETDEIVFNMFTQVNPDVILEMEPKLPEENPEVDITAVIDFNKIYDMIETAETEFRGDEIESPPWNRKPRPVQKVKQVVSGLKLFFKLRGIINSAEVTPKEAEDDIRDLVKEFFRIMIFSDRDRGHENGEGFDGEGGFDGEFVDGEFGEGDLEEFEGEGFEGFFEDKKKITGEVIG